MLPYINGSAVNSDMLKKSAISDLRKEYPLCDGWAIRTWLISNESHRAVVQASVSDSSDHIVASAFGESDCVCDAEDLAIFRLRDVAIAPKGYSDERV